MFEVKRKQNQDWGNRTKKSLKYSSPNYGDQIKEGEMGRTCRRLGEVRNEYAVLIR
jgi:hypothetical protein